jgi:Fe-S-cluster-containing hydrogenase component 2
MSQELNERIAELQEQLRQGKIGRRDFMRYAMLLGLTVGTAEALAACAPKPTVVPPTVVPPTAVPPTTVPPTAEAQPSPPPSAPEIVMEKGWQLVIDYDKCSGCRTCEIECAKRHFNVINPALAAIRIYKVYPGMDVAMFCRNCNARPCIDACPTTPKAITIDEKTGANKVDLAVCIHCFKCKEACQAQHVIFHPTEQYPIFCDLCDLNPACVAACPEKALSVVPPAVAPDTWAEPLDEIIKERKEKLGLFQYMTEA